MDKLVVVLPKDEQNSEQITRDIAELGHVSVTASSESFIDVEVESEGAKEIRDFARLRGLTVVDAPKPELMEPISPWKTFED